jgi:outer membrane protein assembly factor BamA
VDFFGVGPVRPEIETDYAVAGNSVDAVVQWQPTSTFGLSVRAGMLDLETGRGTDHETPDLEDRFSPDEAPGLLRQPRYMTAGVGLARDTRNSVRLPASGVFIGAALWRFVPLDAQSESFTRGALDWRAYRGFGPGLGSHVVAARLLASLDPAPDHSPVPFYLQRWLGGSQSLRGYESYRFRGQVVVHVSLEHRWRAARFVEIVPFVDAGAIATGVRALRSSPLEVTPGIGVRVRTDTRVLGRVDWARRSGGNRILFSLTPAF